MSAIGEEIDATVVEQKASAPPHVAPDRRRIATNFLTLAGTSVLGLLITILVSIYVRRVLGPTPIGQVSWTLAALSYLGILVNPGLTTVGQRELARSPAQAQDLLSLILTLQTILAVAVYTLVLIIAALDLRGPEINLLLIIQGVSLFVTAWNVGWVLQAHERMVAPSIANLVFNALQLPALLLFIHRPDDVYLYAALCLPAPLLGAAFNFWYAAHRGLMPMRPRPRLAGMRALFREAWPLALAQGAVLIYFNSSTLILGVTHGDETVGQYATAYRLMMVSSVVTAALWNAYFPVFSRSRTSAEEARKLSREYLGLLAWMGLPIAALGWAVGRHVVSLMYGPSFDEAGPLFEWLCVGIGFQFLNYGISASLVPWGYGRLQFKIVAAGAIANLALNAIAIPRFGPWGAVAITLATEALILVLGLIARKKAAIFWHPVLPIALPPILSSIVVALAIAALPEALDRYWWLELLAGSMVLAGCLWAFERKALATLLTKLSRR
jgi:O-antigen/teichoic acid export membrane protein